MFLIILDYNKIYQIKTPGIGYSMRGAKVSINDYKGKVSLLYKNKPFDGYIFEKLLKRYYISFDTVIINKLYIYFLKLIYLPIYVCTKYKYLF